MIGGKVIGIARAPEYTALNVEDDRDTLCIRVKESRVDNGDPVVIRLHDSIWWQGAVAMWTPADQTETPGECGTTWDIRISKLSYSH